MDAVLGVPGGLSYEFLGHNAGKWGAEVILSGDKSIPDNFSRSPDGKASFVYEARIVERVDD